MIGNKSKFLGLVALASFFAALFHLAMLILKLTANALINIYNWIVDIINQRGQS